MKNHYTLNPGEFYAAQEILRNRKDLQLCFPIKDSGWDLLAIKPDGSKPVRIQVKESRVYRSSSSWHQLRRSKLIDADVFVFVMYSPVNMGARLDFAPDYIVFPKEELERLCTKKKCSNGKYSFYFICKDNCMLDQRESRKSPHDVSAYHRAWHLI